MSAIREGNIGYGGTDEQDDSSPEYSPTITLKRGKVEIKIKNSAAIIKKIDEMYPGNCNGNKGWNHVKRDFSDAEKIRQRNWMDSAKTWFQNEVFGEAGDYEVLVEKESRPAQTIVPEKDESTATQFKKCVNYPLENVGPYVSARVAPNVEEFQEKYPAQIQSVNKNAYELRQMILENAIGVVNNNLKDVSVDQFVDKVMEVSNRFYSFVENRKRN